MGHPTQDTSEAVRIFEERQPPKASGADVNAIGVDSFYDESSVLGDMTIASPSKTKGASMPGEFIGGRGTTVYNPLRSDPRVEAILGKEKYNPKAPEDTPQALKLELEALKNKLESMTQIMGARLTDTPQKISVSVEDVKTDDEPNSRGIEDFSMLELREVAKASNIKVPVGTKKVDLIKQLQDW